MTPLVVQYLHVRDPLVPAGPHPSVRTGSYVRYLECAVTHAASLRLRGADCEIVLATNIADAGGLGRRGAQLLSQLKSLDVDIRKTEFRERGAAGAHAFSSSRIVRDAILAGADGQPADRQLWVIDLDCVWIDPARAFAAAPPSPVIGGLLMEYPEDWTVIDGETVGATPLALGALAAAMGGPPDPPPWVAGELLSGTAERLHDLVTVCEELDARLADEGTPLASEQQVLSLARTLALIDVRDLAAVARRIQTGARAGEQTERPEELGLWHLTSEKGLSLRRTATDVLRGRTSALARDLADPARAARRFNVESPTRLRRIRDDGWLLAQSARTRARSLSGR